MAILTHHHPSQPGARSSVAPALLLLLLMMGVWIKPGAAAQERPYQIKAAFLANFAQYVEWPPDAFPTDDSPLVFGVLGDNPFGTALKDLLGDEVINGRNCVVEQYKSARDIGRCHVLYISESERARWPSIMRALKGRSILTVSDIEGFSSQGGMIRFVTQTRIRFRINVGAAQACNLAISSKLLRLAEGVETMNTK